MSENPLSLTNQLANRVKTFAANLGLSQRQIAKLLKLDEGHLSKFLDGKAGLSDEMTLKVVRLTSLTKKELDLKFGNSEKVTSKIMHLQEVGKPARFDWVPGQSGEDPNGGSIDDVPIARDLPNACDYEAATYAFLRGQQEIYRSAIQAIDDYLINAQKAKPNFEGVTEGPRQVDSNQASRNAGTRPIAYQTK